MENLSPKNYIIQLFSIFKRIELADEIIRTGNLDQIHDKKMIKKRKKSNVKVSKSNAEGIQET